MLHERLRELETEVRNLEVLPAAAVRARGRSRGRRQMTALLTAGAVVATTAGITLAWPHERTAVIGDRPSISPAVSCVLTLPGSPSEVQVRVLDGGAPAGLPAATASQLRARGFTVLDTTTDHRSADVGALRYGPAAIGAATLMRAEVHGDVTMQFEPDRRDAAVDLIIGAAFTRLATTTETNQNLVVAGKPAVPLQCVSVTSATPRR